VLHRPARHAGLVVFGLLASAVASGDDKSNFLGLHEIVVGRRARDVRLKVLSISEQQFTTA
jgi:hypothetical protein